MLVDTIFGLTLPNGAEYCILDIILSNIFLTHAIYINISKSTLDTIQDNIDMLIYTLYIYLGTP